MEKVDNAEPASNKVGEDLQIECLARYGCVFHRKGGKQSSEYWDCVWNWLRTQYPHMCADPTTDYPTHKDKEGKDDIQLLNEFFNWQNMNYEGVRS